MRHIIAFTVVLFCLCCHAKDASPVASIRAAVAASQAGDEAWSFGPMKETYSTFDTQARRMTPRIRQRAADLTMKTTDATLFMQRWNAKTGALSKEDQTAAAQAVKTARISNLETPSQNFAKAESTGDKYKFEATYSKRYSEITLKMFWLDPDDTELKALETAKTSSTPTHPAQNTGSRSQRER